MFRCRWHGCTRCYVGEARSLEMSARWEKTRLNMEHLEALSYNPDSPYPPFTLVQQWECEWTARVRADRELAAERAAFRAAWSSEALDPRSAGFGGRLARPCDRPNTDLQSELSLPSCRGDDKPVSYHRPGFLLPLPGGAGQPPEGALAARTSRTPDPPFRHLILSLRSF